MDFQLGIWAQANIEELKKENIDLRMKVARLQGNMDAVMTILKYLVEKDWDK